MAWTLWIILQILIGYNLILPVLLFVLYKAFGRKQPVPYLNPEFDYCIIVTAYQQTESLKSVVASILKLNYEKFLVYIVADNCDVSTLHFADERIIMLRPETTLASNTKSHLYALERIERKHDIVTIIDSDNICEPNYLREISKYFTLGFDAVQGVREAKNLDTTYACLDAARDIYYHFYDAKILFALGSSATLSGSGMAFRLDYYLEFLQNNAVIGAGFDKVLQNHIVSNNKRIAFAEKAIVYDEKTSKSEQLVKQRSRWINTWFKYFSFGFGLIFRGLKSFNLNQLLFGLVLLRPPLFIFILLSVIFFGINLFISPAIAAIWFIAMALFVLGFWIALRNSQTDKRIFASLTGIPKFIYLQLISLSKAGKANKISVATQHYHTNSKEANED